MLKGVPSKTSAIQMDASQASESSLPVQVPVRIPLYPIYEDIRGQIGAAILSIEIFS